MNIIAWDCADEAYRRLAYERMAEEIARLRTGLRMIETQDYDMGYSAENFAEAVLSGHEPQESPYSPAKQEGGA